MTDIQEVQAYLSTTLARCSHSPQILRDYDSSILQELEIDQTRPLIYKELKRIRVALRDVAKVNLRELNSVFVVNDWTLSDLCRFNGNVAPAHLEALAILRRAKEEPIASSEGSIGDERYAPAGHYRPECLPD